MPDPPAPGKELEVKPEVGDNYVNNEVTLTRGDGMTWGEPFMENMAMSFSRPMSRIQGQIV